MSGGGGGDIPKEREMRFAPYLEDAHKKFLNHDGEDTPNVSMTYLFNQSLDSSVYSDYKPIDIKESFFGYKDDGTTLWEIKNFPSLYDMFGKFIAGLDVCELWGKVYEQVTHGSELNAAVSAQSDMLWDQIESESLPRFYAGMRDINAVQSTAFIVGKSLIHDGYVKSINKFAGDIRIEGFKVSTQAWMKHLEWNQAVIQTYMELNKLYHATRMDIDNQNYQFATKDELWNLNLLNYVNSSLSALAGTGGVASGGGNEPSDFQKAIGGALSGAAAGAMIGGLPGAAIGGAIGLAGSLL